MSSGSAVDSRTLTSQKSTLIPKIDQKLSGKTKFTLQNKISNKVQSENNSEAPAKNLPSKSKIQPQGKVTKGVENVSSKKLDVPGGKRDKIPIPSSSPGNKKAKISNSENVTATNSKAGVKKPQEKSAPNIGNKNAVPLVKTIKMTKMADDLEKKVVSPKNKKVSLAKSDNVKKSDEKDVAPLLDRKESVANIPKKKEKSESKIKYRPEMHKKQKSTNSIESAPEARISKIPEVSKKPASVEKISKIARSPRNTPTRIPTRPNSMERKLFPDKISVKDEKLVENKENIVESKKSRSRGSAASDRRKMSSRESRIASPRGRRMESPKEKRMESPKERKIEFPSERKKESPKEIKMASPRERSMASLGEKKMASPSERRMASPTGETKIPFICDKKPSIEKTPSRAPSQNSQRKVSIENTPEITPKIPIKVEIPENKEKSWEKLRGTSQNSQRKTSLECISERVPKMPARPVTCLDLPPRKPVVNEKPKQVSMEAVPEATRPRTPKSAIHGKERNITISQPDVSFFTRKLTKNLSKDFLNVKGIIAQKIASTLSVKSKPSTEMVITQKRSLSSASQVFAFDFYKKFKYVAFIGQIDEGEGPLANTFVLYQPPEDELLLYDAANCAATQAFMRFSGIDFTVQYKKNAEQMSPSGKVPFVRCGSLLISEFEPICSFIGSRNVDSNTPQDPEESTLKAFMAMVNGMLENAERYICWYDETTLEEHTYPRHGAKYPFPLSYILNLKKRSEERRYLAAQGSSGKSLEEIFREVELCCKHLSQRLGNNKYFFGRKYTEMDALVYGHIYALTNYKLSGPARRLERIVKNYPNLVAFAKNFDDYFYLKKFKPDCLSEVYQRKKEIEPIIDFREAGLVF